MMAVRTRVRLVNPFDDNRSVEMDAWADPNSAWTWIPAGVVERLGMAASTGLAPWCAKPGGPPPMRVGPVLFAIFDRDTADEALIEGDEVRIGHVVVSKLDLVIDRTNQRLIPNPAHPDGPVTRI